MTVFVLTGGNHNGYIEAIYSSVENADIDMVDGSGWKKVVDKFGNISYINDDICDDELDNDYRELIPYELH